MRRIETSTLTNQSLATALLCHTYTADADRLIFVRVFGDQLAGNGDYVAYLTVQRLGAGSAYRVVPITTAAVASGVTAAMLTTIGVPVKSTDVVKVYLTGLAGDTTTPDIIIEVWEDELHITVGAAGAGLTAAAGLAAADITTLLSRLSAARAGYLDNLSAGAVALASALATTQADLTTLLSRVTGAVSLATSTTAAAIRAALGMAAADLDDQLGDIAAVTDPLLNTVPGSYPSGSGGHALGRIGSGQIETTSTVAQSGDMLEVIGGASYLAADGRSFDWTDANNTWPTLTDATVVWSGVSHGGAVYTHVVTVVTATGSGKKVRLQLTAAESAEMQSKWIGNWAFMVWATLSGGSVVPLVGGTVPVKNPPGP